MCRILSIISMLAVLFVAHGSAEYSYEEYTLCSEQLNNMMMMVCSAFNKMIPEKRGMIVSRDLDSLDPIQYVEAKESHPLFRGRFHGGEGIVNSLSALRRRTRQGIVDRCCKTPCHFEVLQEYCAIPN